MTVPHDEPRWARFLYGLVAPIYDPFRPLWIARRSEADLDELLAAETAPGARVLELATGTGRNLGRLLEAQPRFGSYLGVDVSGAMITRAGRLFPDDSRIRFLEADATRPERLPWAQASPSGICGREAPEAPPFDLILSTWFLAHLENPDDTVASALRLLAPGGVAILLFFVEPRAPLRRAAVGTFVRLFRGRFVDVDTLRRLPGLVEERTYPAARLLVFRAKRA